MKNLIGAGLPDDIGGEQGNGAGGDTELANIESIWKAVSDDIEDM